MGLGIRAAYQSPERWRGASEMQSEWPPYGLGGVTRPRLPVSTRTKSSRAVQQRVMGLHEAGHSTPHGGNDRKPARPWWCCGR